MLSIYTTSSCLYILDLSVDLEEDLFFFTDFYSFETLADRLLLHFPIALSSF